MTAYRQIPQGEEVFLDHLAHFVPDMSAAEKALAGLGFVLTPFTEQRNRTPEGFVPAGTGNRCAMLRSGYLEFLTCCSDTPLARRLEAALKRYTGVHLLAMTVADVDAGRAQLAREGFEPDEPVRLTRAVPLPEGGEGEGRFSVVRVPPEKMPEGRIQVLAHHTPDIVWQERWLAHENRIVSLEAVLLVVADPQEAAARYGRFLGREPVRLDAQRMVLRLDRGALVFVADAGPFGLPKAPSMPWIAGYALGSEDRAASVARFHTGGAQPTGSASGDDWLALPAALGGHVAIGAPGALPGWAR
ncbi:MAG: VOC family protein [Salinarimonas sp.]